MAVLALLLRRLAPMHLNARARRALFSLTTSADISAEPRLSSAIWYSPPPPPAFCASFLFYLLLWLSRTLVWCCLLWNVVFSICVAIIDYLPQKTLFVGTK